MTLLYIMASTFIVSAISLIGVFFLSVKKEILDKILLLLVGFAAGTLLGSAFLNLLPEAVSHNTENAFLYTIIGFTIFFVIERCFYWRHCHSGECDVHTFAYLNLFGDGFHNFTDGIIIAISFGISVKFGLITTLAIISHEIPQEIGDFAILIYGGLSRAKALLCNFLCSLTSMLGGLLGYFLSENISGLSYILVPFIAGGFIYISASDLIPELHRHKDTKRANLSFITFLLGVLFIFFVKHAH